MVVQCCLCLVFGSALSKMSLEERKKAAEKERKDRQTAQEKAAEKLRQENEAAAIASVSHFGMISR